MKNLIVLYVVFSMSVLSMLFPSSSSAAENVELHNGITIDNRTMLPMREIFEQLGATVNWDQSTQTITAKQEGVVVELQIGSKDVLVNGESIEVDVPPLLLHSRTRVPVRFVSETLGADVSWDGEKRVVQISKEELNLTVHVNATKQGNKLIIHFSDPHLEDMIKNQLFGPAGSFDSMGVYTPNPHTGHSGPITQEHLKGLTGFSIDSISISDISGLQYAENLESLYLDSSSVNGLSVITEIKGLSDLSLNNEYIDDYSLLEDIKNLEQLKIVGGKLHQVDMLSEALKESQNLRVLTLSNLGITEINSLSALGNVKSIENLYLSGNAIKDISVLEELNSLKHLELFNNQIDDISPLKNLTNLETLSLDSNKISNIDNLRGLTKLESLDLASNNIQVIDALRNLGRLKELGISNNEINNIEPLSGMRQLTRLNISDNQIGDISAVSGMTELFRLNLSNNQLRDLSPIRGLSNLNTLYFSNNQISDISPLSQLYSIQILGMSKNEVGDLRALLGLPHLAEVNVQDNPIIDESIIPKIEENVSRFVGGFLVY
ncbi:leucine-rich repeat domain-containing protein [Bacillus sp. FJAT-45350]|uniref:leucine-rich repeat domain-containing protein n=1 Tax=Bacillus sp. FJAT-45350 TaxID=2011014 RepID=UPI000BB8AEAD|nr:leucine-rich repeat domain-containing protein [Bacillus sp. FJAT-45350]